MSLCDDAVKAMQQYRNSWVELGRILNELVYGGDYKEHGYDDFETYCAKELGLKKVTVQRLMVSYNYLKRHEKEKLEAIENGETVILPSHETIALLDKVHRQESVSEQVLNELRFQAFSKPITDDSQKEFRKRAAPRKRVERLKEKEGKDVHGQIEDSPRTDDGQSTDESRTVHAQEEKGKEKKETPPLSPASGG